MRTARASLSNVLAGVTSFSINGNCAGTGGVFRVDRSWSLDWISTYPDNSDIRSSNVVTSGVPAHRARG